MVKLPIIQDPRGSRPLVSAIAFNKDCYLWCGRKETEVNLLSATGAVNVPHQNLLISEEGAQILEISVIYLESGTEEEKRGINRWMSYPGQGDMEGEEGKWLEKRTAFPLLSQPRLKGVWPHSPHVSIINEHSSLFFFWKIYFGIKTVAHF